MWKKAVRLTAKNTEINAVQLMASYEALGKSLQIGVRFSHTRAYAESEGTDWL